MFLRNSNFLNKVLKLNTDTNTKLHLLYLHIFVISSNLKGNSEIKIYWTDYLKTIGFARPEGIRFKEQFINIFNEIHKNTGIYFSYPQLDHIGRKTRDYFTIENTKFLDLNSKIDYEINKDFLSKNFKNKNGNLLGFFLMNSLIKKEQIEIQIDFLEKFLILNQKRKENAKIIRKYFRFFQQIGLIKHYKYEKNVFFIGNDIVCNKQYKLVKNYIKEKELTEILKKHKILTPFSIKLSQEPKLEKEIQIIIENELKNSEHVKQVQPFRKISGIGEIDTLVELKNGRYLVIEYKFNQDRRVLSQVLGYSFFIAKELKIDIEKIDNIVIQKNFKFSDYGVKTFFKNMYFYSWEFKDNMFELKTPSF